MRDVRSYVPLSALLLAVSILFGSGRPAAAEPFQHGDWTALLERYVDARGAVDYQALAKNRAAFDAYLKRIEGTGPENAPGQFPTREDQLAYYINAYNAEVWQGVLARGPERDSVWTGGLLPGRTGSAFFKGMDITVGGRKTSLKRLEDDVIRAGFGDPRVHAALNCASKSCPRLPRVAFEGPTLDAQLDAAMRDFVAEARNCTVAANGATVTLSKIFDWYEGDFLAYERSHGNADPRVIDYVNRYREPGARVPRAAAVRFFDYDKSVNQS